MNIEMVFVQGGTFTMGFTGQGFGMPSEVAHQVTLSNFSIGKYPITQGQWTAVMGTTPRQLCSYTDKRCQPSVVGEGNNYPMYYVSWHDVQEFIKKLNEITSKNYRLPTEAEWEYAARGGNKSRGYEFSGSNDPEEVSWNENNSGRATHPVGKKRPNELGIYDMSGNVKEWCWDWYDRFPTEPQTNPKGPDLQLGRGRVLRGGSCDDRPRPIWSRIDWYVPDERHPFTGFRLVLPNTTQETMTKSKSTTTTNVNNQRSNKGGCFIATACYGSYDCIQVLTFRNFRDEYLSKIFAGRMFIRFYYALSPFVARWLTNKIVINKFIRRNLLDPIYESLKKKY